MRIEIHPKPDGMQHINLMFCEEDPGPEDLWVSAMLNDFPAPPKRILQWEREGRQYKVMQYGQCIIGNVMFYIEKHKGLVDRVCQLCRDEFDASTLPREHLFELISETALEFNQEAKYTVDGSGELTIAVDEAKLRDRVLKRLTADAEHPLRTS